METLNSTEPHYIRCVKPNNVLKPAIFENANIIQQLRCGVSITLLSVSYAFSILSNIKGLICFPNYNFCLLILQFRVFLRQSGSAVLDILQDEHFMSFFTDLVFLRQKFLRLSKSVYILSFLVLEHRV